MSKTENISFSSKLADGRDVHAEAHVGETSEIISISVGPVGEDVICPLSILTPAELLRLEDEAAEVYYGWIGRLLDARRSA